MTTMTMTTRDKSIQILMAVCLGLTIVGCHPSTPDAGVSYEHITGGGQAKRPVGLCELVRILDAGGGVYQVVSIKGQTEEDPQHPGVMDGFTYIALSLVDAWTPGAPAHPVVRISGGPAGNGTTRSWPFELSVGETIGGLLYQPYAANRGFYGLDSLGVFRKTGAGYTHGQLFTRAGASLAEVGRLVRSVHGQAGCAQDISPDATPEAPAAPVDAAPRAIVLGR